MDLMSYKSCLLDNNVYFREKEPMALHTTFHIGGAADIFAVPNTAEEFVMSITKAADFDVPVYVIGRGSNLIFDDAGFAGAVISTEKLNGISVDADKNTLHCGCGASLSAVAIAARDASLSGLEFAYGIPGAVGGAVVMNAGAYGGSVSDVLLKSTYYDLKNGVIKTAALFEHEFGYRESIYKSHSEYTVLSADFLLKPGTPDEIRDKMNGFMNSRKSKQPLEYPSAGSVFKRSPGHYTGQMIEELGLKGYRIGGAEISEKHAGFIVNRGGATCADVLQLIDFIKQRVYESYKVELEEELIYVK